MTYSIEHTTVVDLPLLTPATVIVVMTAGTAIAAMTVGMIEGSREEEKLASAPALIATTTVPAGLAPLDPTAVCSLALVAAGTILLFLATRPERRQPAVVNSHLVSQSWSYCVL